MVERLPWSSNSYVLDHPKKLYYILRTLATADTIRRSKTYRQREIADRNQRENKRPESTGIMNRTEKLKSQFKPQIPSKKEHNAT
jgi:hypothetical protein